MALAFAAAGANVAVASRTKADVERVAEQIRALGVKSLPVVADVAAQPEVRSLVKAALDAFGAIDVMVNCAGVYGPIGPLAENDSSAWTHAIQINLLGTAYGMQEVLPHMISQRKGLIINLSGGGAVGPFPRFSAYATSKAAVVRLTETVAEEVREFGIRVNAIAPGAVNTRLLDEVFEAGDKAGKDFLAKAHQQKASGGTPPEKGAELAVFLASPQGEGITGRLISAVWDDWKSIPERLNEFQKSAMFTLRRIDGRNFTEVR